MPKRKLKTYDVLCAVTRSETYRIEAASEAEAMENAFADGELVGEGDTTNVVELEIVAEEV